MVMTAERLKVPLIAYRSRVDDFSLPENSVSSIMERSVELDRLTLMIYSIIRQMIWLLPEAV